MNLKIASARAFLDASLPMCDLVGTSDFVIQPDYGDECEGGDLAYSDRAVGYVELKTPAAFTVGRLLRQVYSELIAASRLAPRCGSGMYLHD